MQIIEDDTIKRLEGHRRQPFLGVFTNSRIFTWVYQLWILLNQKNGGNF